MKKLSYLILAIALVLVSCEKPTKSEPSSNALVSAFKLTSKQSPRLKDVVFTVDQRVDTGRIYVPDSIPFGCRLDSVLPMVSFASIPQSAYVITPDTMIGLTGSDTLNLSKQPIYLKVTAADGKTVKIYHIDLFVHSIEPRQYVWEQLSDALCDAMPMEQKSFLEASGDLLMLSTDGFNVKGFRSVDGSNWTECSISGLPADCSVSDIVYDKDGAMYYYAVGNTLYSSEDGIMWSSNSTEVDFIKLLIVYDGKPWAIVDEGDDHYQLAYLDGSVWQVENQLFNEKELPMDFPISHYAVVSYTNEAGQAHALIAGGYDREGRMQNGLWNIECLTRYDESGTAQRSYRIANLGQHQAANSQSFAGSSIVYYDNRLLCFGGMNSKQEITSFSSNLSMRKVGYIRQRVKTLKRGC